VNQPAAALARLHDQSPSPTYAVDEERTIVYCNPALLDWTGVAADQLLGRRLDYHSIDDAGSVPGVAAGLCPPPAAFQGASTSAHVSCLLASGRLVYRRAQFIPLGEADSLFQGLMAYVEPADLDATQLDRELAESEKPDLLHAALRRLRANQGAHFALEHLIGRSPAMERVRSLVQTASGSRLPVLVVGPRGSGCAHVARTIHYGQGAKAGAVVEIDAAISALDQFRSTFAIASRDDSAANTLLLTDIDQLGPEGQSWLADQLANWPAHVRLIGTARERLLDQIGTGQFRDPLAHRLSTLEIALPGLDERLGDLPLLAQAWVEAANAQSTKQLAGVSTESLELLALHRWPGNLDELREVVFAAHEQAGGAWIMPRDLPRRIQHAANEAEFAKSPEEVIALEEFLARIETELVERALAQAKGNKAQAARLLGITRPRFYRRLTQLGLDRDSTAEE
jgi:DNA-binding NtrC family response regulator